MGRNKSYTDKKIGVNFPHLWDFERIGRRVIYKKSTNVYPYTVWALPIYTAKTQYWKFETNIPRKGIARPQSQFLHSCVCERFIYSHHRYAYSALGKYVDRSWKWTYRLHTHECGIRDWSRAIPFLGIHNWDFRCSVLIFFRVYSTFGLDMP
jgi:hypothetical protein